MKEIAIYSKNSEGLFELEKLRDFDFSDTCTNFHFSDKNNNELIFFDSSEIFKLDYLDESKDREVMYSFSN